MAGFTVVEVDVLEASTRVSLRLWQGVDIGSCTASVRLSRPSVWMSLRSCNWWFFGAGTDAVTADESG